MSKTAVTRAVKAVQRYYPIALADKTWDNTGLLLDSSSEDIKSDNVNILLTIDLTQSVTEEAIKKKANFIMAYHPFIFRGLKSISQDDPQQRSLIKLIQNNISVYCPHTAVDSAYGGVNDYLADGITFGYEVSSKEAIEKDPVAKDCGMGRLVTLSNPVPLSKLIGNVKCSLGLKYVQVVRGRGQSLDHPIRKIAICAGSGGGVFKGVQADLYYTGELSHHEALYFKESGSSVISCNHTNTERSFLKVIKKQLEDALGDAHVMISETDRDPFELA
ncbi:GTP cyclohydrolase 1 type 2/Nif3 [Scheffersomyces xylosifermentans]|uniref:GTP cyclohydrolase 1 type 2/Nif3 n=1 Tax=Scheffersomyces xylosifermentans TaxID=1304137 RepID=UPI00315CEC61